MNDQTKAAMQMALEALDYFAENGYDCEYAITALRKALAQPQGEWVALTDDELLKSYTKTTGSILPKWGSAREDFLFNAKVAIAKFKSKNTPPVVPQGEPVAKVDANDEGIWADILPDRDVKVGQFLYADPPSVEAAIEATKEKAAKVCESMAPKRQLFETDKQLTKAAAAIRGMK